MSVVTTRHPTEGTSKEKLDEPLNLCPLPRIRISSNKSISFLGLLDVVEVTASNLIAMWRFYLVVVDYFKLLHKNLWLRNNHQRGSFGFLRPSPRYEVNIPILTQLGRHIVAIGNGLRLANQDQAKKLGHYRISIISFWK